MIGTHVATESQPVPPHHRRPWRAQAASMGHHSRSDPSLKDQPLHVRGVGYRLLGLSHVDYREIRLGSDWVRCVGRDNLDRPVEETICTLIHEAAHAMNFDRGVHDCSRSQYHNARFRDAATELGLVVGQVRHYGFAETTLPIETAELYASEMRELEAVLMHRLSFKVPRSGPKPGGSSTGLMPPGVDTPRSRNLRAVCSCPFIIRVSRKTIESTVIRCESCDEPFRLT